ncbi:MAG: hypothetical protein WAL32_16910 [Terriglobales bacterium]
MYRLTARLVLVLMLVGTFAPVALAISAPAPHACCMRRAMHHDSSHGAQLNDVPPCCNHDCCHAVTVSQSPCLLPSVGTQIASSSIPLQVERTVVSRSLLIQPSHSGRAPPQLSIA